MSGRAEAFEYATLRAVPRIERGELINVGVVLYCRRAGFLAARTELDEARLLALDAGADLAAVRAALRAVELRCAGAGCGGDDLGQRFRWLVAPRSTVVQPGPVHTGMTEDPAADLRRLMRLLVLPRAGER